MKKCPYCAEDIQDQAIVCRYCGKDQPSGELVTARPSIHKREIQGLLLVMLLLAIALVVQAVIKQRDQLLADITDSISGDQAPAAHNTIEATYTVTGIGIEATISYTNSDGGIEQVDSMLPWTKSFVVDPLSPLSVVAQNQGGSGKIHCSILEDGNLAAQGTTSAAYGMVTCTSLAGD